MKDKSYRAFPIGQEAGHYLRAKRKRLTASSYRDYESCLDKLARYFADLEIGDLEPPVGTERLEEFLEDQWGARARPHLQQEPLASCATSSSSTCCAGTCTATRRCAIERARSATCYRDDVHQTTRYARSSPRRPSCATGSRCGCCSTTGSARARCRAIQFKHFDHHRKRLTVFTKGGKIRELPIPHPAFWFDLERLILESEAQPHALPAAPQPTQAIPLRERQGGRVADPPLPRQADGRPRPAQLVVRAASQRAGIVAAGHDQRRADAQGPPHRRPARPRRDREPEGRPEAPRPRVDLRRPATSTPTGTSTSSRRRCWRPSRRAKS